MTDPKSASLPPIPEGLQRLLSLARTEARFRTELLDRRSAVAAPASVSLSASERAILEAIPRAQLAAMIDGLPEEPTDRRTFLREAAAAALAVLAGVQLSACPEEKPAEPPPGPPPEPQPPPADRPRKTIKTFGCTSSNE